MFSKTRSFYEHDIVVFSHSYGQNIRDEGFFVFSIREAVSSIIRKEHLLWLQECDVAGLTASAAAKLTEMKGGAPHTFFIPSGKQSWNPATHMEDKYFLLGAHQVLKM